MIENNLIKIKETSIYKNRLDPEVCNSAVNFIKQLQDKFIHKTWDCDLRTSGNLTHNILNVEELRNLKFNIMHHVENYMFQTKKFFDGFICESWINIYEKNYYQEYHDHTSDIYNYICGVIYLTNKNSNIIFDTLYTKSITPQFADIVIFEDDMLHRVKSNEEELRISLAFNYRKCVSWHGIRETNKEKTND